MQSHSSYQTHTVKNCFASLDWRLAFLQSVFIVCALFLVLTSSANADMVFDFQKKMADKDNAEAQFSVGEMYESGRGVKRDVALALEWFNKAAANGHEGASFKLLYLDIEKNGLTADNKNAFTNLKTKAKSGDANAEYTVGLMYQKGVGLKRNDNKALEWYKKAALQGVTTAEQGIEAIEMKQGAKALALKKKEAERKKKIAARKKSADLKKEQERKNAEAEKKKKDALLAKQKAKATAERSASKIAADKEATEKAAKQQMLRAEALRARQMEAQEKKRQALIKARQGREQASKAKEVDEFQSDPCSGKSARFLSTCR